MRTLVLLIVISLQAGLLSAQNTLTVIITDLESNDGVVLIKLSDSKENVVKGITGEIVDNKCTVKIDDLTNGSYAITYFHDENNNGELDFGTFHIPKEGYGYSNDARGFMGPASFKDQLFELNSDLTITMETAN